MRNIWLGLGGVAALGLAACGQGGATSGGGGGGAAGAAPSVASAGGGGLADGEYDCGGGYTFHAMGKVDIKGGQFRYRPYGDAVGGFAPYSVGADNQIHWGGPFPGIDEPPAHVTSATKEPHGFNVNYQGSADGAISTMSCSRQ